MNLVFCVVHTERLHDDNTWKRLQFALRLLKSRNNHATFFIYPFRAIIRNFDIQDRLQCLFANGHEIGQHTHFYDGEITEGPEKKDNLTPENINQCIKRDYEFLKHAGFVPRGFTSGAWMVTPALFDSLTSLRFVYDCSSRAKALCQGKASSNYRQQEDVSSVLINNDRLLTIPTTHSLKDILGLNSRRRVHTLREGYNYQLIYLHDYDLLNWKILMAFLLFSQTCSNSVTLETVAF